MSARYDYPCAAACENDPAGWNDHVSLALDEIDRLRQWQQDALEWISFQLSDHEESGYWWELCGADGEVLVGRAESSGRTLRTSGTVEP